MKCSLVRSFFIKNTDMVRGSWRWWSRKVWLRGARREGGGFLQVRVMPAGRRVASGVKKPGRPEADDELLVQIPEDFRGMAVGSD